MITIARTLAGAAVVVVGLAGCAYTNGVLPHGGIQPDIYDAVGDILVEKSVPVMTYPECTLESDGKTQTCVGETLTGQQIQATGDQSDKAMPFTITIGGQPFYTGSATDVLKQNASVS
ncbi:MAG: hypothetical protein WA988_08630 [Candidatus Nanopelagicales bacterium]